MRRAGEDLEESAHELRALGFRDPHAAAARVDDEINSAARRDSANASNIATIPLHSSSIVRDRRPVAPLLARLAVITPQG